MSQARNPTTSPESSAVVDEINRAGTTREGFYAELPELPLPGTGRRRDDCGDDIPRFCADCGAVSHVGRTCYGQGCPRCWKGWARRRATKITAKLEALRRYREVSDGPEWQGWKFHHMVFSPPEEFWVDSERPLQRTFDLLKKVAGEIGAETGYLFYHPYRGPDGDDRGFWKDVLPDGEEVVPSAGSTEVTDPMKAGSAALVDDHGLQYSPHFHGVLLSQYVETENVVEHVEKETGWAIHRITKDGDSDVSVYDEYDLGRSISYCLSHTGKGKNRVAYRAFGEVANFTANEQVETQMDAAVRSVATKTLGLQYDSVACTTERDVVRMRRTEIETPEEKVNLAKAHGRGASDKSSEETEPDEIVTQDKCEGRLLVITAAPKFIEDENWREKAENTEELVDAWQKWRDRVDDLPNPPD